MELLQAELGVDSADDDEHPPSSKEKTKGRGEVGGAPSYCVELTHDIMENVNNAIAILNDLLNYDKIETGTFRLEIEPVYITRLVFSVVNSFHIDSKKKNQRIRFTLNGRLVDEEDQNVSHLDRFVVFGDGTRIRQIMRNLMSNAIKFTSECKEIEVDLSHNPKGLPGAAAISANDMQNGGCVYSTYKRAGSMRVSVKDPGIGLSKEQLSQLFKEGVQFDVNRLQGGGGSGLGLHISKGLAEQHGGSITATSKGVGTGSTFSMELPVYEPEHVKSVVDKLTNDVVVVCPHQTCNGSDSTTAEPTSVPVSVTSQGEKKQRKVLVVDDVVSNRKLLLRLLERAGHTCAGAVDGQEAIDLFMSDRQAAENDNTLPVFDTILMDYEMPGMLHSIVLRESVHLSFLLTTLISSLAI